jgi:hypothetical protein
VLSAAVLAGSIGAVAGPMAAHAAPASATTRLASSVLPGLAAATDTGRVAASAPVQVTVALTHSDPAAEQAALRATYDKTSPSYHHFMTPASYAQRFGAPAATFDRVRRWLTRDGLRLGYVAPSRTQLLATGTAAQVEQTFAVTLHNYTFKGHAFRANQQAATVPAGVSAVEGLDTASSYQLSPRAGGTAQDACIQGSCLGTLTAQDLWSAYEQPSSDRGLGVKVAILGEGDTTTTITALRKFEQRYGLPTVNVRSVFVSNDRKDDTGKGEWQLDSEAIQGMAPDIAELDYYFSEDLTTIADAMSAWVNDANGPSIANMSIGGCEALNLALGTPTVEQPILRQGALEGRTLFVSTGDTGGSCAIEPLVNLNGVENTGVPSPQWPSTSDAVVAVGGTVLYTNGGTAPTRTLEYTWTHSGGGTSSFVPRPSWQSGISVIQGRCVTDDQLSPVTADTPCRGVPDVSALSGDVAATSYATVDETGADGFGAGTSLSSPLWAGMWARVQAASATPLGFADPLLYGLGTDATKDVNDFTDIAVGTNVQWQAIPRNAADPSGWDYTNGLGVPRESGVVKDIAGSLTPVATANPAPTPDQVEVVSAGSGGGGTPTCGANGVVSDPQGDDWFGLGVNTDDTDLTSVVATYDAGAQAVTWTAHVVNLAANPESKAFEFQFSYSGTALDLITSRDVQGLVSSELDASDSTGTLTPVATTGLTQSWNDAASTVSVTLPLSVYNAAVKPAVPLAGGASLTNLDYFADRNLTQSQALPGLFFPGDEATTSCGFVLA